MNENLFVPKQLIKWCLFGLALIALIFSFTQKMDPSVSRIVSVYWNFGHVVAFYLWTFLCLRYLKHIREAAWLKQFFFALFFSIVAGATIEFIQTLVGREAQVSDLVSDVTGAMLAFFIHADKPTRAKQTLHRLGIFFLALIIGYMHRYLVMTPVNEYYVHQQFPVLFDPATPFEVTRIGEDANRKFETTKAFGKQLVVNFDTSDYSTISFNHFPTDWQKYDMLAIELIRPDQEDWEINIRIHDLDHIRKDEQAYEDRFNKKFKIDQSLIELRLSIDEIINAPKYRKMNINEIASIWLFTSSAQKPRTLLVGKIRLL